MEMWKLGLQIGSKLDVKDTVDKWCEATVVAVNREAAKVYVTYTYWAPKVCVCVREASTPRCRHMTRDPHHPPSPILKELQYVCLLPCTRARMLMVYE